MNKKILLIDDDEKLRSLIKVILEENGYEIAEAKDGYEGLKSVEKNSVNLVLLDIRMPGMNGIDVFKKIIEIKPALPVIIMTGHGSIPLAIEATKLGAYDFLEKPVSEDRLIITVKNALEKEELLQGKHLYIEEMNKKHRITGSSGAIKKVFALIEKAAETDAKVLITGENGTGKELVAKAIHFSGSRANKLFVKVNCSALAENLIESELFGHVKGAFTGALADRTGRFEFADGGTIFLDEIGDINPNIQVKLLHVLQDNEIEKIGSNETTKVDVRLITATNKKFEDEIKNGRFREDLFYRINVININVPPLRERREDIPLLMNCFLNQSAEKHGIPKKVLSEKAVGILINREWKGNVRELENFMEKVTILIDNIYVGDMEISGLLNMNNIEEPFDCIDLKSARAKFEKDYIQTLLKSLNWNITKTAEILGLTRAHLYNKIEAYKISRTG